MAVKKTPKKVEKPKEEKPKKELVEEKKLPKYFYAVGRRKTSVAQVRIFPCEKTTQTIINEKKLDDYFSIARMREMVRAPFKVIGKDGKFDFTVLVRGGGINSQAEAIRLGISRALIKFDEALKKQLKDRGYLTRDSRIVERKKPGLKKARKSPQWAKR